METKDLITFLILAVIVAVIAVVARRGQVVQPPPGAKVSNEKSGGETGEAAEGESGDGEAQQPVAPSGKNRGRRR